MLIELAEVSDSSALREASAKAWRTSRWQSSNAPRIATAVTLPPSVENCASCRELTLPKG